MTYKLSRWGVDVDKKCQICNTALETNEHLFLDYVFVGYLRTKMQQWLKYRGAEPINSSQVQNWMLDKAKGSSMSA